MNTLLSMAHCKECQEEMRLVVGLWYDRPEEPWYSIYGTMLADVGNAENDHQKSRAMGLHFTMTLAKLIGLSIPYEEYGHP